MSPQILLIDDDPSIVRYFEYLLNQHGYSALCAAGSAQALGQIAQNRIFVVLLDVSLEGESGLEVLKKIKASHPELPVIMVTGYHEELLARQAMEAGALDYVTKPVEVDYLLRLLESQKAA